jgi:Putative exporter of polyketide antibiotics
MRVTLQTHRRRILAWVIPLMALLTIVAPSYSSTYPRLDQREHLISSMGSNAATRLLYGPLPEPGTIGQLVTWEMGTYLVIATAVLALLLGVSFGRGAEDTGTAELVQACGYRASSRLGAAAGAVATVTVGLGAAVAAVLLVETAFVDELSWQGALGLGAVTACCGLFFGFAGLLAGELADSAGLARLLGFVALAAAFGIRAIANVQDISPLRWFSPLGWIDAEAPYTHDRWWALLIFAAVCALIGLLVWWAGRNREYASAPLHARASSADRLRIRSVLALTWRLERGRWLAWTVIVTAVAALFGGMSGSLIDLLTSDESTAKLMRQLTGERQLDAVFFSFAGVMIGLLVGCYAVLTMLGDATAEADGTMENLLTVGARGRSPLLARIVVAAAGSLAMLLVAGGVGSLVALTQLPGGAGRCFSYIAGQWPAELALIGITGLVIGVHRRWGPVAWLPVAGSGVLVLMGSVLHAPDWLEHAGVFAHVPSYADGSAPSTGVFGLLACFVAAATVGGWRRAQRDVEPD